MSFTIWLLIPLLLICLSGISINAYILLIISVSRQFSSVNNLLLLHLGSLNIILGVSFLTAYFWAGYGYVCHLHGFLFTLLHSVAIWTICGLNADRYYAIAAPLHYLRLVNAKKVIFGLAIGWLISIVCALPPLLFIEPKKIGGNAFFEDCVPAFSSASNMKALTYASLYTLLTLFLPLTLILWCNAKVLIIARYHRHRIATAIFEVALSAQVAITHQRNPFFVPPVHQHAATNPRLRSRSPISSVLQFLGTFIVLYVPYYILVIYHSLSALTLPTIKSSLPWYYRAVFALLTASPMINGFLYGLRNKSLRRTFQNYWRKKVTKIEVQQEIQARTPSTCGSRRPSLTPLGFILCKPAISSNSYVGGARMTRRMSEALLRPSAKENAEERRSCIKRASSELAQITASGGSGLHEEAAHGESPVKASVSTGQGLLRKIFGFERTAAPRILITRAISDQQCKDVEHSKDLPLSHYAKRKISASACSVAKLGSRSRDLDLSSKSKLLDKLRDYSDDEEDYYCANKSNESLTSVEFANTSDASSGLYINLDVVGDVSTTESIDQLSAALISTSDRDSIGNCDW